MYFCVKMLFADFCLFLIADELLEEYRRHQEGPDPSRKLRENVSGKIYRIKKFLAFMAEGKTNLSSLVFLNETARIHK